ncbi:MAG: hypothetical protein KA105_00655 [Caulobacter sp.]|nr:hypothetical protein [Caulobacter sp.]
MPTTAYSSHFGCELDVRQLLARAGYARDMTETPIELTSEQKAWIRQDVLCPSCGVSGAIVIREAHQAGTGRKVGQAHFRFPPGAEQLTDAHRPGCEFHEGDPAPPALIGELVSFGAAKTNDTRLIRLLVCKAIAARVFSQADIRAMRQWYFERNTGGQQFVMQADVGHVERAWALARFRGTTPPLAFLPIHATLPLFRWPRAAARQLAHEFGSTFDALRGFHGATTRDAVKRLARTYFGHTLPRTAQLDDAYARTLEVASIANDYGGLRLSGRTGYPDALLALSALLVHVAGGDTAGALARFSAILAAPEPGDLSLGNVMGLNPFRDYLALGHAERISELAQAGALDIDLDATLVATEQRLRATFQASGLT